MQTSFDLKEWVTRCYCPTVLVATTPSVEEICSKNNLNFVQLLTPFAQLDNIRLFPFKLESGPSCKKITSLTLRFVSIYEVSTTSQDSADTYLSEYCRKLAPNAPVQLTHLRNHNIKTDHKQKHDTISSALRICSMDDVDRFFTSNPDPTPWFSLYQRKFLSTLRFNNYEFLDAPIAIMYVCSTRDDDPVGKLKKLSDKPSLPRKFANGIYSSNIHKVFILLHDKHDVDLRSRVQFLFQNVCKSFDGHSCKLLHINSNNINEANYDNIDLWQSDQDLYENMVYPAPKTVIEVQSNNTHCKKSWSKGENNYSQSKTKKHGIYLSDNDVTVLTQFISDFCIYGVMPWVEKKICGLYVSIAQQRKGITNTFKKLFQSRKVKPHIEQRKLAQRQSPNKECFIYSLNSIESQIRQLADLCFLFQQYHVALEHYKLCQSDYENDGTKSHLCGCLEMSGLCCALLSDAVSTPSWMKHGRNSSNNSSEQSVVLNKNSNENDDILLIDRREMEKYFDLAFRGYCDIGNVGMGTRTCMWWWMSHCYLGHSFTHDMISSVLLRPSERESKHRSAMLLEQAAFAYLRAGHDRNPCIRKYAFHLILAAHLYKECEQKEHSIRCYSRAMMVYAERGWYHIEDHINYNLGYLSSKVLRFDAAIEYFLELLGQGRGSMQRQKNFLDKFISIISKWPNNDNKSMVQEIGTLSSHSISNSLKFVPNLNIPKFNPNSFLVILDDPNLSQNEFMVIGEDIHVQFEIENPLKRTLVVSNLCLHLKIEYEMSNAMNNTMLGYDDLFEYTPSNITLNASECKLFSLSISAKHSILENASISLVGIRWQIFDCMQGFYQFSKSFFATKSISPLSVSSFLKMGSKSIACFQKDHRSISDYLGDVDNRVNLVYKVTAPMAHIVCKFDAQHPFPKDLYSGELCPVVMECTNVSQVTAVNIVLTISNPSFLTICLLENNKLLQIVNDEIIMNQDLKAKESMKLLIWVYGSHVGRNFLEFRFTYNSSNSPKRSTIISRYLTVHSLMDMTLFTKDHFGDIDQYILGISIENIKDTEDNGNNANVRGVANDIESIQLRDMTSDEKQNLDIEDDDDSDGLNKKNEIANKIQICYVGCYSKYWKISKLIDNDSQLPNLSDMCTLSTFLKLQSQNSDTCDSKFSQICFVSDDSKNDVLNPSNDVCQNVFLKKQKEHERKLKRHARIFHHHRQKHKNELEMIVSYRIISDESNENTKNDSKHWMDDRFGYLLLKEPFVFVRKESTSNCPLRVALKYPKKLPIVSLPVRCDIELMVLNTGSTYVSFNIETLLPNEEFDSQARSFIMNEMANARSKYEWVGNRKFSDQLLEPGGYESYKLEAEFASTGIFNLCRYRFIVKNNDSKSTNKIFFFPTQHLIVVGAK